MFGERFLVMIGLSHEWFETLAPQRSFLVSARSRLPASSCCFISIEDLKDVREGMKVCRPLSSITHRSHHLAPSPTSTTRTSDNGGHAPEKNDADC